MPKGRFPYRRTIEFLSAGRVVLKKSVKTITFSFTGQQNSRGLRNFILKDVPQLQYKNPLVQLMPIKDEKEFPHIKLYFDDGKKLLIDVDRKNTVEILNLVEMTGGATETELQKRKEEKYPGRSNPANFGKHGNCFCICEKPGQVPCTARVPAEKKIKEWHLKNESS